MKRAIVFLLLSSLLISCSPNSSNQPSDSQSSYIENKGSDTIVNLALAWAERYQGERADVRISVTGGAGGGPGPSPTPTQTPPTYKAIVPNLTSEGSH